MNDMELVMTRLNMFEILKQKYNINDELYRIRDLFKKKLITNKYTYDQYTLEDITIPEFLKWSGRGTCINYVDMRKNLDLYSIEYCSANKEEDVILCLEYYINIIKLFKKKEKDYYKYIISDYYSVLIENINKLLDYLHYQKYFIEKEDKVILILKDPAAMAVAEQSSEDTSLAILMYNHASLKGDIETKKEILRKIAKEYENLLTNKIEGYKDYFDKARYMLNEFDIRHNNTDKGKSQHKLILEMTNEEIEKWLDELYQLLLFCVLIRDNVDRKNKIAEFLKTLNKKD